MIHHGVLTIELSLPMAGSFPLRALSSRNLWACRRWLARTHGAAWDEYVRRVRRWS
jgi:hypothetical protein